MAFLHGVEVKTNPIVQPAVDVNLSTIGVIGIAPYADPNVWPLNTPVLVSGYDTALIGALTANAPAGVRDVGTLPVAFATMLEECSPVVVAIRVEGSTSYDPATLPQIIGGIDSNGAYRGVHAFLAAESMVGYRPRLLCAPGYTHQKSQAALVGVQVDSGGSGYTPGSFDLVISDSTGGNATAYVTINDAGSVTDVTVTSNGAHFSKPLLKLPEEAGGGNGARFTAQIADLDSAVVAELKDIAERLRAVVFADSPNTTSPDAFAAAKIGGARVMMIDPWIVKDIDGISMVIPPSAKFAALQAYIDQEYGFWRSLSNQPLHGLTGLARPVDFALGDESSAANLLNGKNISTVIRRAGTGFVSWGNRALDGSFLCVQRTIDEVNEALLQASMQFVDLGSNRAFISEVVQFVNGYLRQLQARGAITGGKCWADMQRNTASSLKNGQIYFNFDIGPTYPAERITFTSQINDGYVTTILGGEN